MAISNWILEILSQKCAKYFVSVFFAKVAELFDMKVGLTKPEVHSV